MATNNVNRQMTKYVMVDLGASNIGSAGYTANIPRDALVISVGLYTETAFNGTGTVTCTITDGTTAFVNAQDIKTTGSETVAASAKFYASGGTIQFNIADANSNSSAGRAIAYVGYLQLGNGCVIQD